MCIRDSDCPKGLETITSGKMPQPDVCGYIGVNPVVCCEPGPEMTTRPTTTLRGDMQTISQRSN